MFWMCFQPTANVAQEQFWKRCSYNLGAVFAMAAQEHSRGDTEPLGGFGFALCNFHQCLHILLWLLRLDPDMLKSPETLQKLLQSWREFWDGGMEGWRRWGSFTWFQLSGQITQVTVSSFKSPVTTLPLGIWNIRFVYARQEPSGRRMGF